MSRPLPITTHSLAGSWRGLIGWTLGLAAVLLLYLPLFPSIGGGGQLQQIIDSLPPQLVETLGYDNITTGAGYTQSTFFGLMGFVLLTIASTAWGASALAGAEESGALELTLAHGVGRVQFVLEIAFSVLVRLLWLGAFAAMLILALDGPSELGLDPLRVFAASVALVLMTFLSASAALAVGGLTGRRTFATAAGAGIAVAGYALNAVAQQSPDLENLRAASPYAWAFDPSPLTDGADAGRLLLLGGVQRRAASGGCDRSAASGYPGLMRVGLDAVCERSEVFPQSTSRRYRSVIYSWSGSCFAVAAPANVIAGHSWCKG